MGKENTVIRMCIITKERRNKSELFRLVEKNGEYVLDINQKSQSRGIYLLKDVLAIEKISKHKRYKVNYDSLITMLDIASHFKSDKSVDEQLEYILINLKHSKFLMYGLDDCIDGMKAGKIKLLILPKNINSKQYKKLKNIGIDKEVKILEIQTQDSLAKVFDRDVNVIGIFNKKVAQGIIKKLEVIS